VSSYPEKIPSSLNPIKNFHYNLDSSKEVKQQLESHISKLNDRIDKIIDNITIEDVPVLKFIINITENKQDLKKLAKAVDRIADLIDLRNQLLPKLQVIKMAEKEPNWFANTFGDFSSDIDKHLDELLNGD